jgi:hypothetical protein
LPALVSNLQCFLALYQRISRICCPGLGANVDKIRELEEEKSKLSSHGEQMAASVAQLQRKLKNLESFMITASVPSSAPAAEKRTSVSRHSWAPGRGSRYDADAAPVCLLPSELQEEAAGARNAWGESGSAEEMAALREMADLLRQENEALRASGASGVCFMRLVSPRMCLRDVFCLQAVTLPRPPFSKRKRIRFKH